MASWKSVWLSIPVPLNDRYTPSMFSSIYECFLREASSSSVFETQVKKWQARESVFFVSETRGGEKGEKRKYRVHLFIFIFNYKVQMFPFFFFFKNFLDYIGLCLYKLFVRANCNCWKDVSFEEIRAELSGTNNRHASWGFDSDFRLKKTVCMPTIFT